MHTLHALEFNLFMQLHSYYYMNQTKPGQGCLSCCMALVACLQSPLWCHLITGAGCCGLAEMFTQGWHIWHSLRPYLWLQEKMALSTKQLWVSAWINPLLSGFVFSGSNCFWTEAMALILPSHITLCDLLDVSSHVEEKRVVCTPFQCLYSSDHIDNK